MRDLTSLLERLVRSQVDFVVGLKNLYLDTDDGRLDCLGTVLGIGGFAEVKRRSVEIELPFGRCRILALDALIEAKTAMGRPHDKEAVLQLTAIREQQAYTTRCSLPGLRLSQA